MVGDIPQSALGTRLCLTPSSNARTSPMTHHAPDQLLRREPIQPAPEHKVTGSSSPAQNNFTTEPTCYREIAPGSLS